MQTNPAGEQSKSLDGPRVRGISPVEKEKVYGGKDLCCLDLDPFTSVSERFCKESSSLAARHSVSEDVSKR